MNLELAVGAAKQGQVNLKTESKGIIHAAVGKVSFPAEEIEENIA